MLLPNRQLYLTREEVMTETRKGDPVRQEFMDMYEEAFIEALEKKGDLSEEEEDDLRVETMIDVAMTVRKKLDPLLATKLKSLESLKDYRQYLFAEFKIFGLVPKSKVAHVFAEYLLLSIMDAFEAEEVIDFDYLGEIVSDVYKNASPEYQAYMNDLRRIFPWGRLID